MNLKIIQKQDRALLEEHAKSSFNFGYLERNELYVAIIFLLVGITIELLLADKRLVGAPFIIIGLIEIIKYPSRERRWVKRKEKEKLFNKSLEFEVSEDHLRINFDKEMFRIHPFKNMRACLVSETGILFKISWQEYYYISFKSLSNEQMKLDLIKHLRPKFKKGKFKGKA